MVGYWFCGLPNMRAWLMRWLCPVNSMSRPWWTMRSMIAAASLSSARIVPHLPNSMFVVRMMLLLSYGLVMIWWSSLAPSTSKGA